ncbi:MAG: PAS domain S-box protein [Candidatus Thorarchaeota archaeon]
MSKKTRVKRDSSGDQSSQFTLGPIKLDGNTLSQVISDSHDATLILSKDLVFEYVSEAGYRIFGGTEDDLVGHSVTEFMDEDTAKTVTENFSKRLKGKEIPSSYPITILAKDGLPRYVNIRVLLIKTVDGEPKGLVHVQNRTDEKISQTLLEESEKRYRTLVESMNDGLAIDDANGILLYANEAFCKMLEYTPNEIIGKNWIEFTKTKDYQLIKAKMEERKSGKSDRYELEWVTKSGRLLPTIISASPIYRSDGIFNGTFAVVTEITAQKEAEDTVQFYLDLLTHDISNQLQVIMTSGGLLDQELPKSYLEDAKKDIHDAVERCHRLITKVKRAGQMRHLPRTKMDLTTVVKEKVAVLERVYGAKVTLKNLDDPHLVWADALLGELIWNIMENAARHNPTEDKRVWISVKKKNGICELDIADNGPGISEARKELLFDKTKRMGGVGLTLVSQMARKYGGAIEISDRVKDNPSEGAKFILKLILV